MTAPITTKEYVKTAQKARSLLFDAYVEFLDGDDPLKACDKLWQAASPRHNRRSPAARLGVQRRPSESLNDIICR